MTHLNPRSGPGPYRVERLGDGPILERQHFVEAGIAEHGDNINGPSVIRVPDWIAPEERADPAANYYLYFADHRGTYIRMAWAAAIDGPWTLFNPGMGGDGCRGYGVLDLTVGGTNGDDAGPPRITLGETEVKGHIASPDAHVDHGNHRVVMYFHGGSNASRRGYTAHQKTFVATSATGLDFNVPAAGASNDRGESGHGPRDVLLGNAYMRVFGAHGGIYAYSNGGQLWRAPETGDIWAAPADDPRADAWEPGPKPLEDALGFVAGDFDESPEGLRRPAPRHATVRRLGDDTLELMFTVVGDAPERIYRTQLDVSSSDWNRWRIAGPIKEVLRPERPWEGARYPAESSFFGGKTGVNELRDPCLFTDENDRTYLFYTGEGEAAIGLARLTPSAPPP